MDQDRDQERTRANQEADPESGGSVPSLVITGAIEQVSRDRKAWWEIMFPLIYIHGLRCSALTPSVPKVPSLFQHSQVDFLLHICRLCSLFKRCLISFKAQTLWQLFFINLPFSAPSKPPSSLLFSYCTQRLWLYCCNYTFPSGFQLSHAGFKKLWLFSLTDLLAVFERWGEKHSRTLIADQLQLSKFKRVFSFRLSPSYFRDLPTSEICLCIFNIRLKFFRNLPGKGLKRRVKCCSVIQQIH